MTEQDSSETEDRKDDHIQIVQEQDVETTGTGFEDVQLVHEALPELNYDAIDPSIEFLGHELSAPIFIESMTGGHPNTTEINRTLARAASETGIAMGLGSQRAGLELDGTLPEYYSPHLILLSSRRPSNGTNSSVILFSLSITSAPFD